ncbi:MAG: acyl carrier protein [Oscillospiraceae bacterium]
MENKLISIFSDCLGIAPGDVNDELNVMNCDSWDSVMQLTLVSEMESAFDIMFEPDDIVELTSFAAAKEIAARLGAK